MKKPSEFNQNSPIVQCIEKIKNINLIPPLNSPMKYLLICGCTISGVGKGSFMSSLGALLKSCGLHVTCIKIDPYLNVDAGLMSPYEHGEVFVLDDGGETDLDLGNYERTLGVKLTCDHNITSGKVFQKVINSERKGEYLGKTVQMIPHVTDKIKEMIKNAANIHVEKELGYDNKADICLIELGGTVGDIESTLFFEAIRQLSSEVGQSNLATIMLTYIPEIGNENEQKSKPTQNGIRDLKSMGLFPDFIICRSEHRLQDYAKKKITFFSNVPIDNVFSCYNVDSIWEIPGILAMQDLHFKIINKLNLPLREYKIMKWIGLPLHLNMISKKKEIKIAICGKYIYTTDTYYSVLKSLEDAAMSARRKLKVEWIDCSIFEKTEEEKENKNKEKEETVKDKDTENQKQMKINEIWETLETSDGILIPGGFGKRGIDGMIEICKFARENLIPFLGICLGMQIAVIEFCRNVLGIKDANSIEFDDKCKNDVITTMEDTDYVKLGGTLRLGAKTCIIKDENSLAFKIYGKSEIKERHRHRFEVNPKYIAQIEEKGMIFSGKDINSDRMEILEIPTHPFFFGSQFHPEFKTYPFNPTPVFYSFILCSSRQYEKFKDFSTSRISGITYLQEEKEVEKLIKENEEMLTKEKKKREVIEYIQKTSIKIKEALNDQSEQKEKIKEMIKKISENDIDEEIKVDNNISLREVVKMIKEGKWEDGGNKDKDKESN